MALAHFRPGQMESVSEPVREANNVTGRHICYRPITLPAANYSDANTAAAPAIYVDIPAATIRSASI